MDKVSEGENQEQITLMDKVSEGENQEQTTLMDELDGLEKPRSPGILSKNQNSNKINQFTGTPKLPLPYIKNLRKWINNDKKAS